MIFDAYVLAHPYVPPTTGHIANAAVSSPQGLIYQDPHNNLTNITTLQERRVTCLDWQRFPTPVTAADCEGAIQAVREFPLYRIRQTFIEDPPYNSAPILPGYGPPPFLIRVAGSHCVIALTATFPKYSSVFRWFDVRQAAERILEECERFEHGGVVNVGPAEGPSTWTVSVVGRPEQPGGSSVTGGSTVSTD
ncbi:MAG: hypothetical protein OHK93_007397 [Ramalina farinacea]|uniref:Uncharacterized protein n=1 Tax=Ramalina farinacea TaxID=258253 RepID=A0AA43QNS6_9LECA|nr:hypothetical protein [Ramalina farinacea]